MSYTKTPWKIYNPHGHWNDGGLWVIAIAGNDRSNRLVANAFGKTEEEAIANARLLTTAPELLNCCEAVLEAWHSKPSNFDKKEPAYMEGIRKAISKAKGL